MSEHTIQCAFIEWVKWNTGRYPELELLYAVPNGGKRSIAVAGKLKAEGVRAGVPDIVLPVARGGHHSLYMEFKNGNKGVVSPDQSAYISLLVEYGNAVMVVRSIDEAIDSILMYLNLRDKT